jgi:hypothetical protein
VAAEKANLARGLALDQDAERWDLQRSEPAREMRQNRAAPGREWPRAVVAADLALRPPPGLELRGRRAVLVAASRTDRRPAIVALAALTGRPVISGARLWALLLERVGGARAAVEQWPATLLRALGETGVLVLLPNLGGELGRGAALSLATALRAGRQALVIAPGNRLVEPEAAGLVVVGDRVRCSWQRRTLPPPDLLAGLGGPPPRPAPAPGDRRRTDGLTPAQRAEANLARGRAEAAAVAEILARHGVGRTRRPRPPEVQREIDQVLAEIRRRPLSDFLAGPPAGAGAGRSRVESQQADSDLAPTASLSTTAVVAADDIQGSCECCGAALPPRPRGPGRPRRFCSGPCREAARLRRERGVPESTPRSDGHHGRRRLGVG